MNNLPQYVRKPCFEIIFASSTSCEMMPLFCFVIDQEEQKVLHYEVFLDLFSIAVLFYYTKVYRLSLLKYIHQHYIFLFYFLYYAIF